MISYKYVLLAYVVLLLVGGIIGFVKGKSKISLITSIAFAIPLLMTALGYLSIRYLAPALIGFLGIFFASRYMKTKKFMPGGLMAIASIIALVLYFFPI